MTHSILIKKKRHAPGIIIHYFSTKRLEKRGANKKRKLIRLGKYGDTFLKGGALSYERKYKKKEQAIKSRMQWLPAEEIIKQVEERQKTYMRFVFMIVWFIFVHFMYLEYLFHFLWG